MGLDLLGAHVEHDVAEQPALPHAVHADEGVVVVPLGVVRDAVAVAVEELHAAFHGCGWALGISLLGGPETRRNKALPRTALDPDGSHGTLLRDPEQEQLLPGKQHPAPKERGGDGPWRDTSCAR